MSHYLLMSCVRKLDILATAIQNFKALTCCYLIDARRKTCFVHAGGSKRRQNLFDSHCKDTLAATKIDLDCMKNVVTEQESWLLHDNANAQSKYVISRKDIKVLKHSPYSEFILTSLSDLVLCDFWLLPKLKLAMTGKRCDKIQNISRSSTAIFGSSENEVQ
ncbi:hypothetical protein X777_07410 [Ooceraea biroi]|uniref:Uncharacterized protein n=1 Tax=Ooceraea biroi TaxID=2015173 RepID=A0A026WA64_OOCBI|nr:hypothetical protein X777_07410 [Ooceraea biroi]